MKKIKIGIVGEHPKNDSEALRVLLEPFVVEGVQFKVVAKNFKGGQLDGEKFFNSLETEVFDLDWVILSRDLDGIFSESTKLAKRDKWFLKANKNADKKGIFFLAIAEMEALILADIQTFNKMYGIDIKPIGNPMMVPKPKEKLEGFSNKSKRGKYQENDATDIFKALNFRTIYDNHKGERSFQAFAKELVEKQILDEAKMRTPQ
jgi:hypothetical protein